MSSGDTSDIDHVPCPSEDIIRDRSEILSETLENGRSNDRSISGCNGEEDDADEDEENNDDDATDEDDDDDDESEDDEDDDDDDDDDDEATEESEDDAGEKLDIDSVDNDIKAPLSPNSVPTCYICLNEFDGQEIGSPDSCENIHHFCLECIEEWSKQINTCPVDRKSFSFIFVKRCLSGDVIMKLPVKKKSVLEIETIDEDLTYCEICGRCDREDRLLLCDGCDFGYHCECLDPPLETIPVDEWFCPECFDRLFEDDVRQEAYRRQSNRRAIARTGAFEAVRNRILARRTTQPATRSSNSVSATKKTKKTKKRRKRKTRKAKKTIKSKTTKGKKRRKTKKRTRKSKQSAKRLPSASVRSRIASRLGITCKAKHPFGMPSMSSASASSTSQIRSAAGIGNLSMFGYELEFNNPRSYEDQLEFEAFGTGELGLIARKRSHISYPLCKSIKTPPRISNLPSTDLLSEILNSQEILHAASSDLGIAKDGRIYLKQDGKNIHKCPDSNSQPSSSPPSSTNNNNGCSSNNNGYLKQSTYSGRTSQNISENDISLVKPSPVVALFGDKPDFELYSDIESIGDNKEETEENGDKKKRKNDVICNISQKETTFDETNDEVIQDPLLDSSKEEKKDSTISAEKRRPSIKDLFGGDSEEEVDDDIKQLVAQQGSINVHFPIKMPIVLKSKFLSDKNASSSGEVPISKKWIPIYPEAEKSKSTGPKWKTIGQSEEKKPILWESNEQRNVNTKPVAPVAPVAEPEKPKKPAVIIETRPSVTQSSKQKTLPSTSNPEYVEKKIFPSSKVEILERKVRREVSPPLQLSKKIELNVAGSTKTQDVKIKNSNDEPDNKKVRLCKHGRLLKKDKTKDAAKVSVRKRSRSAERFESKKDVKKYRKDDEDKSKISRVKIFEKEEDDNDDNVNWKKLSSSSKMRNYRDGKDKDKDSDLVYKDRRLKSERDDLRVIVTSSKASQVRRSDDKNKRDSKPRRDRSLRHRYEDTGRKSSPSTSYARTRTENKSDSKVDLIRTERIRTRNEDPQPHRSSSRRNHSEMEPPSKSHKQQSYHSHTHGQGHSHSHHHHHHHHHRHKQEEDNHPSSHSTAHNHRRHYHSNGNEKPSKSIYDDVSQVIASTSTSKKETALAKPSSTYQTYPTMKSVDSKEIYAQGDKIIINVNFKQEKTTRVEKAHNLFSNNENDTIKLLPVQPLQRKDSPNNYDDRNIKVDILSPQSNEDYSIREGSNNSIASPLSNQDLVIESPINRADSNKTSSPPNLKKAFTEEFSFLPRILQINETNSPNDLGHRTPDQFLDDSFMPTPTQDESHSPMIAANTISRISKPTNSNSMQPTSSIEIKDDFYDPELPLQSPDRNSIKSPNSSPNVELCDDMGSSVQPSASTIAAAQKLASIGSINFNQLFQIAKTINGQNVSSNNHIGNSGAKGGKSENSQMHANESQSRDVVDIAEMDTDSPTPFPSSPPNNSPMANIKEMWNKIMRGNNSNVRGQLRTSDGKKSIVDNHSNEALAGGEMDSKEKFNKLERVVDEIKVSLKPHYQKHKITKEEYKEILRKSVPKVMHSKSGQINPAKVKNMIEAYVKKVRYLRRTR